MSEPPALSIEGPCGLNVDPSCLDPEEWNAATPSQQDYALEAARAMLNALTAGEAANCPVLLRPCRVADCMESFDWHYDGVTWAPRLMAGVWTNTLGCGCDTGCQHESTQMSLPLPRGVAEVVEVWIDGALVDPSRYHVSGRWLVRSDGLAWPQRQDMDRDYMSEPETFAVIYRPGRALGLMGERALGSLVREFLRACSGSKKCSLPAGIQTLTRQGVTYDVQRDGVADGVIGIREVDFYVATINPYRLRQAPAVYVPGGLR